nr:unnamed protein product [Callosobruchus analis]
MLYFSKKINILKSTFCYTHIACTICINTTYMLNFILFENNYHFTSIGVQNTSSPLFIHFDMACTSFFAVDTFVENGIH